jgi:outer membrane protein OmpA-like peptidoglycan-associated protein
VTPASVIVGDTVTLNWAVNDDEPARFAPFIDGDKVAIQGVKYEVPQEGVKQYTFDVRDGDTLVVSKTATVRVAPRPVVAKDVPVVNVPVAEEPHAKPSNYAKGLVNYKAANNAGLSASVFSVDVRDFPSKVRIYVSVRDANGNLVANLAPPYNNQHGSFWKSVSEQYAGSNRTIDSFTVTEYRTDKSASRNVSLVADYSGSMENDINQLELALDVVHTRLHTSDIHTLVQFDHRVFITSENVPGSSRIARIPFSQLSGGTAFYAASVNALSNSTSTHMDRIAILFTDGYDNSSLFHSAYDVANASFRNNARTFVIGLGNADADILQKIALNSNGKYYQPKTSAELDDIYEEIFREFEAYYVIEYSSKAANDVHAVNITIQPQGQPAQSFSGSFVEQPQPILETNRRYMAGQFGSGSASLVNSSEWKSRIDTLVQLWKTDNTKKILVIAHSDTRGNEESNRKLSEKRAAAIKREIVKRGVPSDMIIIDGKGETEPIYEQEMNKAQLQENRRVELVFI